MHLRFLFFMTLAGIAVLDREIESVSDKHLVIAKNISEALERYAVDLKNGFELVAAMPADVRETPAVSNFLESLDLLYFCVVDRKTGVIRSSVQNKSVPLSAGRVAPDRLHQFLSLLDGEGLVFSPVMIDESGRPALFLLRATAERLFIAAVSTDYIVKQGKLVSFGEKGYAAIVDHRAISSRTRCPRGGKRPKTSLRCRGCWRAKRGRRFFIHRPWRPIWSPALPTCR